MDKHEQKFSDNTRVRLKDGIHPSFYSDKAAPGNIGWIRKHRQEKYGYNWVFVEWDRDHWAYNGVPDCWTWENHFENAEQDIKMANSKKKNIHELSERLAELLGQYIEEDESGEHDEVNELDEDRKSFESRFLKAKQEVEKDEEEYKEDDIEVATMYDLYDDLYGETGDDEDHPSYEQTLEYAIEAAHDADAFIMITVNKSELGKIYDHQQITVPMVFHNAADVESSILAHIYMSQLSSNFTLKVAADRIRQQQELDEEE